MPRLEGLAIPKYLSSCDLFKGVFQNWQKPRVFAKDIYQQAACKWTKVSSSSPMHIRNSILYFTRKAKVSWLSLQRVNLCFLHQSTQICCEFIHLLEMAAESGDMDHCKVLIALYNACVRVSQMLQTLDVCQKPDSHFPWPFLASGQLLFELGLQLLLDQRSLLYELPLSLWMLFSCWEACTHWGAKVRSER